MRSSHISDQFIFESIKLDGLYSTDIKCAIISVLDLSKTEITDKAILALLIELRRIIEKQTEQGENSIVYGDNGRFYHWTERIGGGHLGAGMSGVNTFEKFVKAITARNSKKITSELALLKNCFEDYFKMLKKENMEFKFGAGAQFIVSKKQILQRPKEFYLKIIELLNYDINPIEGFVIERFHSIILNGTI